MTADVFSDGGVLLAYFRWNGAASPTETHEPASIDDYIVNGIQIIYIITICKYNFNIYWYNIQPIYKKYIYIYIYL